MRAYPKVFPKSLRRQSRAREPPSAGKERGLGPALSRDIVKQHNGTLKVATEPGEFT
jgi:signal transduction histidine kinase